MKPVNNTHEGLTAQNKVTLLLFLQLCKDGNFSHVVFEDADWEDATFHFNDGKRIFLEVKNYTSKEISLNFIKTEVFSRFKGKLKDFGKDDSILIAAPHIKDEIGSYASSLEYLSPRVKPQLQKRGFTKSDIALLKRTLTFEYNEWLDENLIAYLTAVLGFWLPPSELVQFKDHLLQSVVSTKSAKGASLTVQEFIEIKEAQRATLQVGMYDEKKIPTEARTEEILSTLNDDLQRTRNIENPRVLSSLMSSPSNVSLLLLALEAKLTQGELVNLEEWKTLFLAAIHPAYTLRLVQVFKQSLASNESNSKFFMDFWADNIIQLIPPFQDGYLVGEIMKTAASIVEEYPALDKRALDLVLASNQILNKGKYADNSHRMETHDEQMLGELLLTIFKTVDESEKQRILDWVHENFCLNRDEGQYLFSTPASIYQIWSTYLLEKDTQHRLEKFIRVVDEDYLGDPFLLANRGKLKGQSLYQGFDHMGGGIGNNGGEYSLTDRAYIELVLKPVFAKQYKNSPSAFWDSLPNFVTTKESEVGLFDTGKKPDYLSRALIPILVQIYLVDKANKSNTVYKWLGAFIRFRKGIPSRTDLIFQELFKQAPADEKAWKLVRYQMDLDVYKKTPANIFVEKILQSLLEAGATEPIEYASALLDNELYLKFRAIHDFYLTELTQSLISQKGTREQGIVLLNRLITSSFFNDRLSDFEVYDIKGPIQALYTADATAGNALLREIISDEKMLTKHRQIALTSYLREMPDDPKFLSSVYNEVFKDIVNRADQGQIKLYEYLSHSHTREEVAEFAGKLCKAKLIEQGMAILEILVNDPSPEPNEYSDEMKKPDDMHVISSVKAHVAWAAQQTICVEGRPFLSRAFKIVEKLATDENIYIRSQACFPLTSFIRARHWHMPDNESERFVEDLKLVRRIDTLALRLLESKESREYRGLIKGVVHVVSYMRAVDMATAKRITKAVLETNETGIVDYLPTLFFFAEFREGSFADWRWGADFPLGEFSPTYFRKTLKNLCANGSTEVKGSIAWTLWSMYAKDGVDTPKAFEIIDRYVGSLISVYGREWYDDLYHLANDLREAGYIEKRPEYIERAITLWEQCIKLEHAANEQSKQKNGNYVTGRYYDSEMLLAILDKKGDTEFQIWLSLILNDPASTYLSDVKGLYEKASVENQSLLKSLYPHTLIKEFGSKK